MRKFLFLSYGLIIVFMAVSIHIFAQSNKLINDHGELLWQYSQTVSLEKLNTISVTFVFINGINQTAVSLRQELFHSQIELIKISDTQTGKENSVEFFTANLAPGQSIIWKYDLKTELKDKKIILEKSALFIMNENFEIRKEIIPEQTLEPKF